MNFLNPLILFGLFAASIPIILHLLNLRKLKTIEFSSLKFLKELQKTKIRKVKIKQIILLILRTLIIIFIVLAFARPTIKNNLHYFSKYSKTSAVILIDNSFSLEVSDENGTRFNQVKKSVITLLSSLKEGDEVSIIPMSGEFNKNKFNFFRNLDFVRDELNKIVIRNSPSDLSKSLKFAALTMEKAININKEIFIISDCQQNIFDRENFDSTKILTYGAKINFIRIGSNSKSTIKNLSIDSLNVLTKIFQLNKLVEVEAIVKNNSNSDINGVIVSMRFNNETVAQRTINIPKNESRSIGIAANASKTGACDASIEIEGDALELDNKANFGFAIPELPKIVLIGSDKEEESFIKNALLASFGLNSSNNIQSFESNQISAIDLSKYQICVLFSGNYQSASYTRLLQYVQKGGSVIIFPSLKTDVEIQKLGFSSLGFGLLTEMKFDNNSGKFQSTDLNHPIFDGVFKLEGNSRIIESPNLSHVFVVNGGQKIIELSNNAVVSESRIGDGKIIFIGALPELNSGNFPLTGIFPTLLYRSSIYLNTSENLSKISTLGKPVFLNISNKFASDGNLKMIDPKGNESFIKPIKLPSGMVVNLKDLNILGVYSIYTLKNELITQIALNPEKSESYLNSVKKDYIENYLKSSFSDYKDFNFIEGSDKINEGLIRARMGSELWQIFLILALIFAVAELFVQKAYKNDIE